LICCRSYRSLPVDFVGSPEYSRRRSSHHRYLVVGMKGRR
jgi:hypothetical protein